MAGINRTTGKATDLITFSRASGGTALRKISYGSELVTNGTFDSDSDWTLSASSISGGNLAFTPVSVGSVIFASNAPTVFTLGKVYQMTYTVISNNLSSASMRLNFGGGNIVNLPISVGSQSVIVYGYATKQLQLESYVNFVGGSLTIDNISVKEVLFDQPDGTLTLFNHPTNIPRIGYDAAGNVKGLLIEEARTNLVTYSEDFTGAGWSELNATKTTGIADPYGGTTAMTLTATASNGQVLRSISGSLGTGTNYTGSFYIRRRSGTGTVFLFNPNGGGITATAITSEWTRYSVTGLGAAATNYIGVRLATSGDEVDIAYAQLEAGSFPTSYIPTSGATATRAADIASISVDNFGYNQKAGTVVVEATATHSTVSNAVFSDLSVYKDASNSILLYYQYGAGRSWVEDANTPAVLGTNQSNLGESNKRAVSLKGSSAIHAYNGTLGSDTSIVYPTGLTDIYIGSYGNIWQLNGHIKSIAYYPRRLSNAQLQALTA